MNIAAEYDRREAAIQDLIDRVRRDRHIIACFLCGSTARGDFWYNSDIDVTLITTDESIGVSTCVLVEGGCWFEAYLYSREKFRQICEKGSSAIRLNNRVLYCEDSTLLEYFEEDGRIGDYKKSNKVFVAGAWCYFYFQKIEKYCGRGQSERAYSTFVDARTTVRAKSGGL